jgi:large repetitive protein
MGSAMALCVAVAGACTMKSQEAPALTGPSEFGTSVTVSVSPDVLTQDGASQSLVTITARDPNGAPLRSLSLRAEIAVEGVRADFGSLSARNLVTDSAGRATLVYTAPFAGTGAGVDTGTVVDILVTPVGTDFGNSTPRFASIRLVPPGIIVPPDGLQPRFTVTPASPQDHQDVFFDASTSSAPGNNPIVSYAWDFGDGATGSARTATHSYDVAGTYFARLTISDGIGRTASTTQPVNVGQGSEPTASFTVSPSSQSAPLINEVVNFNGSASRPAAGRTIQSYSWDFGDGSQRTTTSALTTHDFAAAGDYTVTLSVTDDAGRVGNTTRDVRVFSDAPIADFTFSPASPLAPATVLFNAAISIAAPGRTIVSYFWTFENDGSTSTGATPSHAFPTAGEFNVLLVVTDSAGKTGRVTKSVTVR